MNHHYGVPCSKFEDDAKIKAGFELLTTSTDKKGVCYGSTFQGKGNDFPITGTQWHPEKPGFEWELPAVPHHMDAIRLGQATASRVVALARGNGHRPRSGREETEILLYNYDVDFTAGPKYGG